MNIRVIIRIHDLICIERTGKPTQFAEKIGVSKRTLYEYLSFMKNELNAPIVFNREKESYRYYMECGLCFIEKNNLINRDSNQNESIIK